MSRAVGGAGGTSALQHAGRFDAELQQGTLRVSD